MWLFILLTQALALATTLILGWFFRPKKNFSKVILTLVIFALSNVILFYGLSEIWHERFRIYLIFSILQGFMVYAALITVGLGGLYCRVLKRKPRPKLARLLGLTTYIGIIGLSIFNGYSPVVKRLTVTIDKPLETPMTLALVSDTHWGKWFGNRQIDKLVSMIDGEQVDAVVLAGDIMDDTTIYYDKTNMAAHFSQLQAPLGVYAVLGNHDYLGYEERIAQAVTSAGITVLDNESVLLDDKVWLVGRSDDLDRTRLTAADLLKPLDTAKPTLFLEHRPSAIAEISALPIDLHLSGHTHGGQIFPLTTLMHWFSPLAYGTKTVNDTQFLVSSGFGIGSVPFRLGTRSEIWIITLKSSH